MSRAGLFDRYNTIVAISDALFTWVPRWGLLRLSVRVNHVMEARDVMNIHVVEHSILNGIEYCTFWFRSVVEMTRHQLLLHYRYIAIIVISEIVITSFDCRFIS
jgi:hypothetical protein